MTPLLPPPRFAHKTPAGRRSSPPDAPGGQPDPLVPLVPAKPRWARCPVDEQLHLVAPVDAELAETEGYAHALCGRRVMAEGLTLHGQAGTPCASCLAVGAVNAAAADRAAQRNSDSSE